MAFRVEASFLQETDDNYFYIEKLVVSMQRTSMFDYMELYGVIQKKWKVGRRILTHCRIFYITKSID